MKSIAKIAIRLINVEPPTRIDETTFPTPILPDIQHRNEQKLLIDGKREIGKSGTRGTHLIRMLIEEKFHILSGICEKCCFVFVYRSHRNQYRTNSKADWRHY
jgi:hypothetical protein